MNATNTTATVTVTHNTHITNHTDEHGRVYAKTKTIEKKFAVLEGRTHATHTIRLEYGIRYMQGLTPFFNLDMQLFRYKERKDCEPFTELLETHFPEKVHLFKWKMYSPVKGHYRFEERCIASLSAGDVTDLHDFLELSEYGRIYVEGYGGDSDDMYALRDIPDFNEWCDARRGEIFGLFEQDMKKEGLL